MVGRRSFHAAPGPPSAVATGRVSEARLALAKEQFLRAEPLEEATVREAIQASWVRSREFHISADAFEPPFVAEPDAESRLEHSAGSVLAATSAQIASEPASLILTDADGVVLDRRVGDTRLRRKLDRVRLIPGFSYSERHAGTNGIGTALEARGPAQVFGHEHYVEHLEDLACAGAPIHHPVTGKVVGLVDLTCWREDANRMMAAVVATLAQRIEEALLADTGHRELSLLRDYMAACRRGGGPVLAVSNDLVMLNDVARQLIDPRDQAALLGTALEALSEGKARVVSLALPSGGVARLNCRPSWHEKSQTGGIAQVQLYSALPTTGRDPLPLVTGGRARSTAVGSSPRWVKCCQTVDKQVRSREWLDVNGEPGVGKLAVIRAAHLGATPSAHLRVLDGVDYGEKWLDEVDDELRREGGTVVLRHVDRLPGATWPMLTEALLAARDQPGRPWVVITRATRESVDPRLARLIGCFPSSVQVPPLRHHIDDLPELVPVLLNRLTRGDGLHCSAEAMRVLMRQQWPGNVAQLIDILQKTAEPRRTGVIAEADLPAGCRATSRRVLSPMESIERDAIVDALTGADGNRALAARDLGMSRATIYRKIRQYGISVPSHGRAPRS